MLGVPERFDLDVRALSSSHRRLQFLLHPDKFALRAPQEQRFAAEHSSFLNKAFSVLSQPVSRAEYLLGLKARPAIQNCGSAPEASSPTSNRSFSDSTFASSNEDEEVLQDPELLSEVLELNEALDAVGSDMRAEQTVRQLRSRFEREAAAIVERLAAHFAGSDLSSARAALTRLKFFANLLERAKVVQRDQIDARFSKR